MYQLQMCPPKNSAAGALFAEFPVALSLSASAIMARWEGMRPPSSQDRANRSASRCHRSRHPFLSVRGPSRRWPDDRRHRAGSRRVADGRRPTPQWRRSTQVCQRRRPARRRSSYVHVTRATTGLPSKLSASRADGEAAPHADSDRYRCGSHDRRVDNRDRVVERRGPERRPAHSDNAVRYLGAKFPTEVRLPRASAVNFQLTGQRR